MNPDHETVESETSAVSCATNPAANAVKHGFCAKKILTPETFARAEVIREELTRIHDPWSNEEVDAIATLAIARAQQFELEQAMRAKVDTEKKRAAEVYDKNASDRFAADLAKFRDRPDIYGCVPGMTWRGADWLITLWRLIADLLTPDSNESPVGLPLHLVRDAAAALGSPWQVDRAGSEGAWLMARYVRISPDPDTALERWVDESNALDGRKFASNYARRLVDKAPADSVVAAAELRSRAIGECDRMSLKMKELRSNYETEMANAAEVAVGTGSGDPAMEKEFRLLTRYLTAARNRADRIEKRLDTLKRDRKRLGYRLQRDTENEARRLKRESEKALRRFEDETAQNAHGSTRYDTFASATDYRYASDEARNRNDSGRDNETRPFRPAPPAIVPDSRVVDAVVQHIAVPQDTTELRNGSSSDEAEHSKLEQPERPDETRKPEAGVVESLDIELTDLSGWEMPSNDAQGVAERTKLVELTANGGRFAERAQRLRYRDWTNPAEVQEDEATLLRNLKSLPDSFAQGATIRALFGTQGTFRRAWRAYSTWADAALVAAAEEMHRTGAEL